VALNELEQLGEDSRLLRWIQQPPKAVVQQHKTLLVVYIRLARLGLPPKEVDESINRAILRAKIQSQQGDSNAALTTIESLRDLNSRHASNIWLDQDLIAYQALFRLHQGDLTSAERLLGGGWEIDKNPFSAFGALQC